jgi:hypothetical protein
MVHNSNFRFGLSDKNDRGICPKCGRKDFTPYKDYETNQLIDKQVCGKCSHIGLESEGHCNYHLPPREYFNQHPERRQYFFGNEQGNYSNKQNNYPNNYFNWQNNYFNYPNKYTNRWNNFTNHSNNFYNNPNRFGNESFGYNKGFYPTNQYPYYNRGYNKELDNNPYKIDLEVLMEKFYKCDYIPKDYLHTSVSDNLELCSLGKYLLSKKIDREDIIQMSLDMGIRTNYYSQTLYYLTDKTHKVRSAKIMDYDTEGHRIHYSKTNKNVFRADASWLHTKYIKEMKEVNKDFKFRFVNTVFGYENLMQTIKCYGVKQTVCWLFEAEKTASIIHLLYKKKYPHIAMIGLGGEGNLSTNMLLGLKELEIDSVLAFPDKGYLEDWKVKAEKVSTDLGIEVLVSDKIETSRLKNGEDLVDFVL